MKSLFTKEEIKPFLDEFYSLYKDRPVQNNDGGMKSPHMFPLWYILKKLKPEAVIESGVFKGNGTWLIEKACPQAKLLCIDPNPYQRVYTSSKALYTTYDFSTLDLSNLKGRDVLVFFDDHQNSLNRIKKCKELGFKKIMVEDNYPIDQGDCYSPKKILSRENYVIGDGADRKYYEKNLEDYDFLTKNLEIYQEVFPIFKDSTTIWNTPWDSSFYNTPDPLLTEEHKDKYPDLYDERKSYYWLCYMQLK